MCKLLIFNMQSTILKCKVQFLKCKVLIFSKLFKLKYIYILPLWKTINLNMTSTSYHFSHHKKIPISRLHPQPTHDTTPRWTHPAAPSVAHPKKHHRRWHRAWRTTHVTYRTPINFDIFRRIVGDHSATIPRQIDGPMVMGPKKRAHDSGSRDNGASGIRSWVYCFSKWYVVLYLALLPGPLHYPFFYCALAYEPVDGDLLRLTQTMGSIHRLLVHCGIPVRVVKYDLKRKCIFTIWKGDVFLFWKREK